MKCQRRVGAGEQHEPELGHGLPEECGDPVEDRRVVDEVEVVEHQHHRTGQLLEPGDEAAQRLALRAETGDQSGQGVVRRHRTAS